VGADRFLDDMARTLAEPMPRGRAVKAVGAALVTLAVPGIAARPVRAAVGQYQCNPNVETCCGQNERVCLKGHPVPINKGYCCGPSQFMWCGSAANGHKCISVCPTARRCGQICCPPTTRCKGGKCVPNVCGGRQCREGQDCCPSTQLMPQSRCYDPDTHCCTPVKGVVPKRPIADLDWCPNRVPKPGHTPGANGCGSVGHPLTPFIPNNFLGANLKPACDDHDRCYETCNRNRRRCDSQFHQQLKAICRDQFGFGPRRNACITQAAIYYAAVSSPSGTSAYEDAQKKACNCC
jgi:hypothetical protein